MKAPPGARGDGGGGIQEVCVCGRRDGGTDCIANGFCASSTVHFYQANAMNIVTFCLCGAL